MKSSIQSGGIGCRRSMRPLPFPLNLSPRTRSPEFTCSRAFLPSFLPFRCMFLLARLIPHQTPPSLTANLASSCSLCCKHKAQAARLLPAFRLVCILATAAAAAEGDRIPRRAENMQAYLPYVHTYMHMCTRMPAFFTSNS